VCKYGSCPHSFLPARSFSIFVPWLQFLVRLFPLFVHLFAILRTVVPVRCSRTFSVSTEERRDKAKVPHCAPCARSPSTAALRCISRCCALHSARCLSRVARCILRAACCAHSDSRLTQSAFRMRDRSQLESPATAAREADDELHEKAPVRPRPPSALRSCVRAFVPRACVHVRARVRSRPCVRACACVCDRVCPQQFGL
jgi:hypothetical protein